MGTTRQTAMPCILLLTIVGCGAEPAPGELELEAFEHTEPAPGELELGDLERLFESPEAIEAFKRRHAEAGVADQDLNAIIDHALTEKVFNGIPTNQAHTGALVMWYLNSIHGEIRQCCSGTLYTNNVALTAAHCLDADLNGGMPDGWQPFARIMSTWNGTGWSSALVQSAQQVGSDDVAVLSLDRKLPVLSNGRLESEFYWRSFERPSPGQLHYVLAYGSRAYPQEPSTVCNTGTQGCVADPRPQQVMFSDVVEGFRPMFVFLNTETQRIYPGDSGAAVQKFKTGDPGRDPIVGIITHMGNWRTPSGTHAGGRAVSILDL